MLKNKRDKLVKFKLYNHCVFPTLGEKDKTEKCHAHIENIVKILDFSIQNIGKNHFFVESSLIYLI